MTRLIASLWNIELDRSDNLRGVMVAHIWLLVALLCREEAT